MTEAVDALKAWVNESDNIVFFGGAGVSTESGIPDFRSVDGLYHQQYDYPPETILSHTFYRKKTEEFYRFYRAKCWRWMQSPMRRIKSLPSGSRKESSAPL